MSEPAQPAEPAVVALGGERTGGFERLISVRGWHPAVPRALAGLGGVAMFGSLVGEWQVVTPPAGDLPGDGAGGDAFGLAYTLVWGMGWVVGGMLLAVCGGLTLAGQPAMRRYARTIGLVVAAVNLGILAAAAASLDGESLFVAPVQGVEITLGRGVYAAFASVLLIGAALWLARTEPTVRRRPEPEPVVGAGPPDLTVGPAEPIVRPTDTLQG